MRSSKTPSENSRQGLRMALFIQQALVCAASLLLALSCARTEPAANNTHAPGGSPDVPLLTAAEPVVLSPEDQTEDALNSTRRADESGRAEGGGGPPPPPPGAKRPGARHPRHPPPPH